MADNKKLAKEMRAKAAKDPDQYFATGVLKKEGYHRQKCSSCERFFWSTQQRKVCDDSECSGGFRFIGKSVAKNKMDYVGTWLAFSEFFKKRGYTPIARYPVVARWRDDTDWVQASIYDFQPFVVSGEVSPPANPLVIPQFCLRFNDIDNVGITGSHFTGFVMVGQHTFVPASEWNQAKYFEDLFKWFTEGLGIPKDQLVLHEDGWAGGGNIGPCMEFFCLGLELANQVYMLYEETPTGVKDLKLKVLDMGLGHERNTWFSQGTGTGYDATFPTVMKFLKERTGVTIDPHLQQKFLPFAAYLNADEVSNLEEAWQKVASLVGIEVGKLRAAIEPMAALYSVAEHSRSLLFAMADGAIPSNVGGMYNLRVLLRRAQGFIEQYKWNVTLKEICTLHADYLKPLFPELKENLANVHKILDVEVKKYHETKEKAHATIAKHLSGEVTVEKLIELYDSMGISPKEIATFAATQGKIIKVPDNFYGLVAERHKNTDQETQTERTEKLPLEELPETKVLYFQDYQVTTSTGKVLKIIGKNVVLDQTCCYPVSGGQLHDIGTLQGIPLVDVFKQGKIIVHVLDREPTFKVGDTVSCSVDKERRLQLAQHHTSTHIIGAAARKVLGPHINQASAKKDVDKAYIDVTHYELIGKEDLEKIEAEANHIVKSAIQTNLQLLSRDLAEKKYGTKIYQGGAVPGHTIRIVEIPGYDVQACGGTHLNNTKEAGHISILKCAKVKDGVVRLYFVAGAAQKKEQSGKASLLQEWSAILGVQENQLPKRAEELFVKWKKARKAASKEQKLADAEYALVSKETSSGDLIAQTAAAVGTQSEHVAKTLRRFLDELEGFKSK